MLSKKKPQDKVDPEYLVGLDTASAQPAPAGVKPFIKKHWKPITAAICAAAVAAAVLVPKNSAKPAAACSINCFCNGGNTDKSLSFLLHRSSTLCPKTPNPEQGASKRTLS